VVGRDSGRIVVWPHYFDRSRTRAQGRRVPTELAIEEPRAGSIANAARTLGLKVQLDEDARPPFGNGSHRGRVLIEKTQETKEAILRQIAQRL